MLSSFRRTLARYLRIKGVPACELAEQLGHKSTEYQITEIYISHSPDYLNNAVKAIETLFEELACELRVNDLIELFDGTKNISLNQSYGWCREGELNSRPHHYQ